MKQKILMVANLLFPILAILTFSAIILDIYKYLGFFKKHLFLDSLTLFNILAGIGLVVSIFPSKESIAVISKIEKVFYKLNIVLLPVLIIFYVYFNDLLTKRGLNYVFSKYHIQPQNMPLLIFFSAFILFVYLYKKVPDNTV